MPEFNNLLTNQEQLILNASEKHLDKLALLNGWATFEHSFSAKLNPFAGHTFDRIDHYRHELVALMRAKNAFHHISLNVVDIEGYFTGMFTGDLSGRLETATGRVYTCTRVSSGMVNLFVGNDINNEKHWVNVPESAVKLWADHCGPFLIEAPGAQQLTRCVTVTIDMKACNLEMTVKRLNVASGYALDVAAIGAGYVERNDCETDQHYRSRAIRWFSENAICEARPYQYSMGALGRPFDFIGRDNQPKYMPVTGRPQLMQSVRGLDSFIALFNVDDGYEHLSNPASWHLVPSSFVLGAKEFANEATKSDITLEGYLNSLNGHWLDRFADMFDFKRKAFDRFPADPYQSDAEFHRSIMFHVLHVMTMNEDAPAPEEPAPEEPDTLEDIMGQFVVLQGRYTAAKEEHDSTSKALAAKRTAARNALNECAWRLEQALEERGIKSQISY